MGKALSETEIQQFRSEGWLAPYRAMETADARRCFDKIESFEEEYGRQANVLLRLKSHIVLPWIAELARKKEILDVVEDLIGPNIRLFASSIFSKAGLSRSYVSWHQDSAYFGLTPHEEITAWVAFSESNVANGCLRVLPGSHLGDNRAHIETFAKDNMLGRGQTITEIDEARAVNLELKAGEFSVHHEKMAHSSRVNTTPDRRIGFAFFYIPTHVRSVSHRQSSLLVRGVDTHGHWDDDIEPKAEMEPRALASLEAILHGYRDGELKQAAAT